MNIRHRGFTLTEVLVAIAITALVMALLAFPLFTAFGYLQKLTARSEAQRVGALAAHTLARELGVAMYIFELPPDGSWVSFLKEVPADPEKSLAMPMEFTGNVTLVRYGQTLDFPWIWDGAKWQLLYPNHMADGGAVDPGQIFAPYHSPYYVRAKTYGPNSFVLARFERSLPWDQLSGAGGGAPADATALNGAFPFNTAEFSGMAGAQDNRDLLWRKHRGEYIAVTPYGEDWDVPRCIFTPYRINSEALSKLTDSEGRVNPTAVVSRNTLWAGYNRDLNDLAQHGALADLLALCQRGSLAQVQSTITALNPLITDPERDTNPFGYQIRVFHQSGGLLYGVGKLNPATKTYDSPCHNRHPVDWPPIDRPDWNWSAPGNYYWSAQDVARQRTEGKVVFAQPMRVETLPVENVDGVDVYVLPIPTGGGTAWDAGLTFCAGAPKRITQGGVTYKLVDKNPADLDPQEYCLKYSVDDLGNQPEQGINISSRDADWGRKSRVLVFGSAMPAPTAAVGVTPFNYTICDLQPTDVVVATYSTKAHLDISVTVSRRDNAGRTPEQRRQDATVNQRIEATNAVKRALGSK